MPLGYDDSTTLGGPTPVPAGAPAGYGLGAFFSALANRGRNGQLAEQRGRMDALKSVLTEAQAYGAREEAKRSYGENQGLAGLEASLTPLLGADMARAASQAAYAKYNLHEATQAGLDTQTMGMRTAARDALASGNWTTGQANLAAIDGKPLTLTQVSEGQAFNPNALPGAQKILTTAVGQSMIGAHNAAAAASYASAEDNRASAAEHRAKTQETLGTIPGKPVPLGLDGTQIDYLKTPVLGPDGKPATNPITGQVELAVDPKRLGNFFTYLANMRRHNPKVTADDALTTFAGGDEQAIHDAVAEVGKAREAVRLKRISLQDAKQRFIAAGYPQLADQLTDTP